MRFNNSRNIVSWCFRAVSRAGWDGKKGQHELLVPGRLVNISYCRELKKEKQVIPTSKCPVIPLKMFYMCMLEKCSQTSVCIGTTWYERGRVLLGRGCSPDRQEGWRLREEKVFSKAMCSQPGQPCSSALPGWISVGHTWKIREVQWTWFVINSSCFHVKVWKWHF